MTQTPATPDPTAMVRLLINDPTSGDQTVFTDAEIIAFLGLNSGNVKRAAASALDTLASNEAMVAKVITDRRLSTNGAATATALRAHAKTLRDEATFDEDNADGGFFDVVDLEPSCAPELTGGYVDPFGYLYPPPV